MGMQLDLTFALVIRGFGLAAAVLVIGHRLWLCSPALGNSADVNVSDDLADGFHLKIDDAV
jgi:hypothetical protein